jgi:DNA-binding NtrC family response regulator
MPLKLLLVEDDRIVRITVRDALEDAGYAVTAYADGQSALHALESQAFDLLLTDVRLPGIDGITLFRRAHEIAPGVAVLLMTAFANTDDAVAAMRLGARDYISKPFEMDELLARLTRVGEELEFRRRMEAGSRPREAAARDPIVGSSAAVKRLLERIDAAAACDVNVLLTGETGTGKSLAARLIHERSARADKPFVVVNCAAIPETLFEAELFGHEKGAFTGADRRRVGRFEAASGGTLFLDEIGELSIGSQVKLLRAIESATFEPLGSSRSLTVDVRVLSATNRDLVAEVEKGAFRKDLFYRLNVLDLETPPLRERRADLPILVRELLAEIATRQSRPVPTLDPGAIAALAAHDFPGNVRELVHLLERAVALCRGEAIRVEHLPASMIRVADVDEPPASFDEPSSVPQLANAVQQFEQEYIRRVLASVGGHRGRAAAILGISRKSLWQRLREEK